MVEKVLDEDRRGGYEVAEGFPPSAASPAQKTGPLKKNEKVLDEGRRGE